MAPVPRPQLVTRSFHEVVVESAADFQVVTDPEGIYRFASPACRSLFGWLPDDLVGGNQDHYVHPDDVARVRSARQKALLTQARTTSRFRCLDGTYRWTETISTSAVRDGESLIVSSVRDLGERSESELVLHHQATTDSLTGLANRTVFMDRLQQALRRLARQDGLVAVLFLDLDRFKLINDTLGHRQGDAVLVQMADRLRALLRPQDTVARLGGDEFAILVEDMTWVGEAAALGDRILEATRVPFLLDGERFTCTLSVGVSTTGDSHDGAEDLLQEADLALYRAKGRGRDRAEVFDEDLRTRAVGRLATERMLRRAIEEQRLRVEYQPIIDLRTGAPVAAEALVRVWDPEARMLVGADAFIDVAEEAGLLRDMDDWMIGEVTSQAARWQPLFAATGFTNVAINVTARHLADPGFARFIIDSIAGAGLPTSALQVEVTERILMEASTSAMTGLTVLREAGVKVGLDDFGTGYSSLAYLRMFPLDFVKIDRSFVAELDTDGASRAIVGSIIDLSHALGMEVVAEGIETSSQLDAVTDLGCDRGQGFCLAWPGSVEAIEDLVMRVRTATNGHRVDR